MSFWNTLKRGVTGAATLGVSELAGVYDKTPTPNGNAFNYGGSADAANQTRGYLGGQERATLGQAAQLYGNMAAGQGPSVAQAQLGQGLAQAQAQANATAASARGGAANQLAAARMAQQQGANMALAANAQAAQARAAEQMAGASGLAQIGGQYLGAQQNFENAQLGAQMGLAGANAAAAAADQKRVNDFYSKAIDVGMKVGQKAATGGA